MAKTADGIKIRSLISMLDGFQGIIVREGTKHPFMLVYAGLRPCPIAESTHVKQMVVPWLRQALQYQDGKSLYERLRQGSW